jgi:hypothetical protein
VNGPLTALRAKALLGLLFPMVVAGPAGLEVEHRASALFEPSMTTSVESGAEPSLEAAGERVVDGHEAVCGV